MTQVITNTGQIKTSGSGGGTTVTFPISVANGGTGLTTVVTGDLLYANASNTITNLPITTTATRYLSNTGAGNTPAWSQVNLSNGVNSNLPVTNLNGGTNASATSFWRGDGVWANTSRTLIQANIVTTDVTSVTFANVPQNFSMLEVISSVRGNTSVPNLLMRFNGDTGANYQVNYLLVDANTTTSSIGLLTFLYAGTTQASAVSASEFIISVVLLKDYAATTKYKTGLTNAGNASGRYVQAAAAWQSNAAITTIQLQMSSGNIVAGSNFYLYGT